MTDHYAMQAAQAQAHFLTYDQTALIEKWALPFDEMYLYPVLFSQKYRLRRADGNLERLQGDAWTDANTHGEVMTLLDLLCDSRPDRRPAGRYQSMMNFGLMFHRNLLEDAPDALANRFDREPEALRRGLAALHGTPFPGCEIGGCIPVMGDLTMAVQFWHGDEDFAPRLRFLWDENALMYLRYETMHYAVGLLRRLLETL